MSTSILDMKLATHIIGGSVEDGHGDVVGHIENIVIDRETGQVAYAIVSRAGFMGMNKKLFAVPWLAFHMGQQANNYVLDASREVLRHAPEFDYDHQPDWTNVSWNREMYQHYQLAPFWQEAQAGQGGTTASQQTSGSGGLLP